MRKVLVIFLIIISIIFLLNIEVSTLQGINYEVRTLKIPLYLKLLDFFDRHFNYKQLVKEIIKDAESDDEKVMRIFEWTYQNIRKAPEGFPIIDDHVWYIIIRGYGVQDQLQDVFTMLCNYSGIKAFFASVYSQDRMHGIPLSFVYLEGRWTVFDAYEGVYFKDSSGAFANIETIKANNYSLCSLENKPELNVDYNIYVNNLSSVKHANLSRSNTQSPLNRLLFEIQQWFD